MSKEEEEVTDLETLIRSMEMVVSGYNAALCLRGLAFIVARIAVGLNSADRKSLMVDLETTTEVFITMLQNEGMGPDDGK